MTQIANECFAVADALMTFDDALALLRQRFSPVVKAETVSLRRAVGRILAEDVVAPVDVPPHDNAAVDGFAVRFADLDPGGETRLPVVGRAAAGHPWTAPSTVSGAVRVFTGAPMPALFDTVAMQEDCRREGETVVVPPGLSLGDNRRLRGEDVAAGTIVLRCGRRLGSADISLAAAIGRSRLTVGGRLKVAVFSTGDELQDPGNPLQVGRIYDSNRYGLIALLENLGTEVDDLGILEDRVDGIRAALEEAALSHDLIVTSGGMSVGEEDHVKAAVQALGSLHLWRLAIKPGRPIGVGHVLGRPFIGLPGNPVAMVVTFVRLARPAILSLAGATDAVLPLFMVQADFSHKKKLGRREWVRAHLLPSDHGPPLVRKFSRQGSGILSSLVECDGLVELAEDVARVEPGMDVPFLSFQGVL